MKDIYIDKLNLYYGETLEICDGIEIHVPTLSDIRKYGEVKYYQMVHSLCSVGIDLCWQLEKVGIPFDKISDFELFSQILCRQYSAEDTKILFGEWLDFSSMKLYTDDKDNSLYLVQYDLENNKKAVVNKDVYFTLVSYLREMHNLKRDDRVAGTNSCRRAFIEDAEMEYEARKNEPAKPILAPMVSTMVNIEGFKRNDETIWEMNIYAFMDSVKRIAKIRNSNLLLQSGYSGFGVDLKKIKNEELNYMGELH